MLKKILFILLIAASIMACKNDPPKVSAETGFPNYGAEFSMDDAISYAEMVDKMGDAEKFPAKIKGTVAEVCKVKGCWMNIAAEGKEDMFVNFKDYGFFMPLDIAGKEVVMQGHAYREMTSVKDLKHYAEDEGLSQDEIDAITEPKEELKFLADGVILLEKVAAEQ